MSNYIRQTYNTTMLHEPPVVYGNLPHHYYPIMQYPQTNYIYTPQMYYQNELIVKSEESISSSNSSPRTLPLQNQLVTPLTPPPTIEERVKETIARANAVPVEFYQTEFLEYSKKTYEFQHQNNKKRKRAVSDDSTLQNKKLNQQDLEEECLNTNELRRQIHIQSEQKRRAQIKDGFDILKNHLPGCSNKKLSKAALLTRAVQQLEHMKKVQSELLAEVQRLVEENASLKLLQ